MALKITLFMKAACPLLAVLLFLFGLPLIAHGRTAGKPPNFIIVFADDFGFDVECFGSPTTRTVNINQMAAEGMKLTQWNTAHSICSPSRAAILTGRYAVRSGIFGNKSSHAPHTGDHRVVHPNCYGHLPFSEVTIAKALKPANYTSMAIGKWHLEFQGSMVSLGNSANNPNMLLSSGLDDMGCLPDGVIYQYLTMGYAYENTSLLPIGHGFDHFYGTPVTHCEGPPSYPAVPLFHDSAKIGRVGIDIVRETLVNRYADQATQFIKNNTADPFFLYLAMDNTHSPVFSPPNFTSPRGPYGAATEALDWVVGQVMATLKEQSLAEDTLMIFTSDNGAWYVPPPTEAGVVGPFQGTYAPAHLGYYDTGKGSSWEGGFRVPAVAWWPGKISPGSVNENFTSSLDLFVTFLSLAEVPVPTGVLLDGKDISHIFDNTVDISQVEKSALSADNYTFFYYRGPQLMAARQGPLKAHFITHSGFGSEPPVTHNPPLIFNVEVDPQERVPVSGKQYDTFIASVTKAVADHKKTVVPVPPQLDLIAYQGMDCEGLTPSQSGCCQSLTGKCSLH